MKNTWYEEKTTVRHFYPLRRLLKFKEFRAQSKREEFIGPRAKILLEKPRDNRHKVPFVKPKLQVDPPAPVEHIRSFK